MSTILYMTKAEMETELSQWLNYVNEYLTTGNNKKKRIETGSDTFRHVHEYADPSQLFAFAQDRIALLRRELANLNALPADLSNFNQRNNIPMRYR